MVALPFGNSLEARLFRGSGGLRWLGSVAAGLISGIWVFDITAIAAQRESRLMEMARPACHSSVTNEELRNLVRDQLGSGVSKKDALRTVLSLCQTKTRSG